MISEVRLKELIAEVNVERKATIAEFLYELFRDKFVDVYVGDAYEEVSTEQVSTAYPAIFSGKVIGAYKECLILNGWYIDRRTKVSKLGKQIFISERAIRGLCEADGNGIMDDIFLRSRDSIELMKEDK